MKREYEGQVLIECPNTIFQLYVNNEDELSKIEVFMKNIQSVRKMGLNDIYNWCNRQGIAYDTRFNFHKEFTLGRTLRAFLDYYKLKMKYQRRLLPACE
ncbi:MAG: hypothetical protein IJ419_14280 [Agathobacter sp.]|nr:hypothetical protein [Agathobacter sp.]